MVQGLGNGGDSQAGRFVVLIGPDGVGKTTIARALAAAAPASTAYFHFRPRIRQSMAATPPTSSIAAEKGPRHGARPAGWLRLARSFIIFWAAHLTTVRPALRRGTLVIGDRWAYGYLGQPHALRFYGPRWLALCATRLLPRPDMVVNLAAPPETILGRKRELTTREVRAELDEWARLPVARLRTFSTTAPPESVATDILDGLGL
jgi:thymidylate kinase